VPEPVFDGMLALIEHSDGVVGDEVGALLDSKHPPGVVVDVGPFEGISELSEHTGALELLKEQPPGVVDKISPVEGMDALE
jgi:hypothetical protein